MAGARLSIASVFGSESARRHGLVGPRKLGLSAAPGASMLGACRASLEDAREPRDPTSHPTPATGLVVDERTRVVGTTIRGTPAAAASRRLPDARLDERGGRRDPRGVDSPQPFRRR